MEFAKFSKNCALHKHPIRATEPQTTSGRALYNDERARQLVDIAASGDEDNVECATVDLAREFPDAGD